MNTPLEGLLRPPVEYLSAMTAASAAILLAAVPAALLVAPSVAYAGAVGFFALACVRARQALRIQRYHRGLKKLPYWEVRIEDIPVSNRWLFFGKGFPWTAQHTQRLFEVTKPNLLRYSQPGKIYRAIRRMEVTWEGRAIASWFQNEFLRVGGVAFRNPFAPLPDLGGNTALHGVGLLEGEHHVLQALYERVAHTYVLGTTRVGKTVLAMLLIAQDIIRGDCVITVDPKGDPDLLLVMYIAARFAKREKDLMIFHLGFPEYSCRYNPVGDYARITEVSTRIAGQLPSEGESATFREFVWGYINAMTRVLSKLGRRADYRTIESNATDLEPLMKEYLEGLIEEKWSSGELGKIIKDWKLRFFQDPTKWKEAVKEFAEAKDDKKGTYVMKSPRSMESRSRYAQALVVLSDEWNILRGTPGEQLTALFKYDQAYYNKLIASLLPFLAKMTTGRVAEIIAPDYTAVDDKRPILEWMSFIRQNGIIYFGLDALSDKDVAATIGSTAFSDLVSTLGRVYKHGYGDGVPTDKPITRNVRLHADEFSDLIRDDFIPLLNKGGGAGSKEKGGFSAVVYSQTKSDIEARLGSTAKAEQTAGNLNTVVMLRVVEPKTAEFLTKRLRPVTVNDSILVTSTGDVPELGSDVRFRSSSEQRIVPKEVDLVRVADLAELPKGQAYVLKDGNQLSKVRLPRINLSGANVPSEISAMAHEMRARYRSDLADDWQQTKWTPLWRTFNQDMNSHVLNETGATAPTLSPENEMHDRMQDFAREKFSPVSTDFFFDQGVQ